MNELSCLQTEYYFLTRVLHPCPLGLLALLTIRTTTVVPCGDINKCREIIIRSW